MKRQLRRVALFSVIMLASSTLVSAQEQTGNEHKLTPSEVKALIKGASTPEEHMALAAYFRDLASQEEATAKYHEQMGDGYQPKPLPSGFQPLSASEMRDHCRYLAANARKAANAAAKMADEQGKPAELMRTAPPQTTHRSR